jgi:hypothetical protein
MPVTDIPIEKLSFPAYRLTGVEGGDRLARSVFLSLNHWFEAEKFRAFHRELFDEVLHQPTAKEARKFAKRNQGQWRGDWLAVRVRAMACGLVYASWADRDSQRWNAPAQEIAQFLAPLGLNERFLNQVALEFVRLRSAPRIAFLGAAVAPPDAVGRRVNMVHKRADRAWTLAHWQGRHGSWRVHDWALAQYIPISYAGQAGGRLNATQLEQFATACDQAVVFETRRGKSMDAVIRALRAVRRIQVELDLFAPETAAQMAS